jgi:hypothetical protein
MEFETDAWFLREGGRAIDEPLTLRDTTKGGSFHSVEVVTYSFFYGISKEVNQKQQGLDL